MSSSPTEPLRLGELFAGYGGLGEAVRTVWPQTELAWYSDVCKHTKTGVGHYEPHRSPCSIMAHHHPGVPNLGDVAAVDWSKVEPVDILTGGSPCQDLSHAGKRAGMTEGTRSNLWVAMREAIAVLRPSVVIWENVRGSYSAEADSALEQCEGCVGDRPGQPVLRALGRVLGDLSDLGYVGGWHGIRAADVGAPHGRFRVFVVAYSASDAPYASGRRDGRQRVGGSEALAEPRDHALLPTPAAYDGSRGGPQHPDKRLAGGHQPTLQDVAAHLLPTPLAQDAKQTTVVPSRHNRAGYELSAIDHLLPTPTSSDYKGSTTKRRQPGESRSQLDAVLEGDQAQRLLPTPRVTQPGYADDGRGGKSLDVEARLLPTPSVALADGGQTSRSGDRKGELLLGGIVAQRGQWGDYAPAIARWEQILGRAAPAPTQPSSKGNPQLSPLFVEWMMGLPAGRVTDVPGLSRADMLKALGNGVVPQQAAAAIRLLAAVLGL